MIHLPAFRGFLLASCIAATACGDAGAAPLSWRGTVDTLPGGALVVDNPEEGLWSEGERWVLREELRIGRMDGTGPDVFGRIAALAIEEGGRIYVLDAQASEVRVFAPDGTHVRTVGRAGQGPGELQRPAGLALSPSGELWVLDPGNARFTVFDTAGAPLATPARPLGFYVVPWPGGFDRSGTLYDVADVPATDLREMRLALVRFTPEVAIADSVGLPARQGSRMILVTRPGMEGAVIGLTDPFASRAVHRLDPRGYVWSALTDRYELVQRDLEGDTARLIRRDVDEILVTAAERDSAVADIRTAIARAGEGARADREPRVPDVKPPIQTFYVDSEGYAWAEPTRADEEPRRLDVFDPDGRYLGAVALPQRVAASPPPSIGRDVLHAVVRDSLDVPYVVRFRIDGRD